MNKVDFILWVMLVCVGILVIFIYTSCGGMSKDCREVCPPGSECREVCKPWGEW